MALYQGSISNKGSKFKPSGTVTVINGATDDARLAAIFGRYGSVGNSLADGSIKMIEIFPEDSDSKYPYVNLSEVIRINELEFLRKNAKFIANWRLAAQYLKDNYYGEFISKTRELLANANYDNLTTQAQKILAMYFFDLVNLEDVKNVLSDQNEQEIIRDIVVRTAKDVAFNKTRTISFHDMEAIYTLRVGNVDVNLETNEAKINYAFANHSPEVLGNAADIRGGAKAIFLKKQFKVLKQKAIELATKDSEVNMTFEHKLEQKIDLDRLREKITQEVLNDYQEIFGQVQLILNSITPEEIGIDEFQDYNPALAYSKLWIELGFAKSEITTSKINPDTVRDWYEKKISTNEFLKLNEQTFIEKFRKFLIKRYIGEFIDVDEYNQRAFELVKQELKITKTNDTKNMLDKIGQKVINDQVQQILESDLEKLMNLYRTPKGNKDKEIINSIADKLKIELGAKIADANKELANLVKTGLISELSKVVLNQIMEFQELKGIPTNGINKVELETAYLNQNIDDLVKNFFAMYPNVLKENYMDLVIVYSRNIKSNITKWLEQNIDLTQVLETMKEEILVLLLNTEPYKNIDKQIWTNALNEITTLEQAKKYNNVDRLQEFADLFVEDWEKQAKKVDNAQLNELIRFVKLSSVVIERIAETSSYWKNNIDPEPTKEFIIDRLEEVKVGLVDYAIQLMTNDFSELIAEEGSENQAILAAFIANHYMDIQNKFSELMDWNNLRQQEYPILAKELANFMHINDISSVETFLREDLDPQVILFDDRKGYTFAELEKMYNSQNKKSDDFYKYDEIFYQKEFDALDEDSKKSIDSLRKDSAYISKYNEIKNELQAKYINLEKKVSIEEFLDRNLTQAILISPMMSSIDNFVNSGIKSGVIQYFNNNSSGLLGKLTEKIFANEFLRNGYQDNTTIGPVLKEYENYKTKINYALREDFREFVDGLNDKEFYKLSKNTGDLENVYIENNIESRVLDKVGHVKWEDILEIARTYVVEDLAHVQVNISKDIKDKYIQEFIKEKYQGNKILTYKNNEDFKEYITEHEKNNSEDLDQKEERLEDFAEVVNKEITDYVNTFIHEYIQEKMEQSVGSIRLSGPDNIIVEAFNEYGKKLVNVAATWVYDSGVRKELISKLETAFEKGDNLTPEQATLEKMRELKNVVDKVPLPDVEILRNKAFLIIRNHLRKVKLEFEIDSSQRDELINNFIETNFKGNEIFKLDHNNSGVQEFTSFVQENYKPQNNSDAFKNMLLNAIENKKIDFRDTLEKVYNESLSKHFLAKNKLSSFEEVNQEIRKYYQDLYNMFVNGVTEDISVLFDDSEKTSIVKNNSTELIQRKVKDNQEIILAKLSQVKEPDWETLRQQALLLAKEKIEKFAEIKFKKIFERTPEIKESVLDAIRTFPEEIYPGYKIFNFNSDNLQSILDLINLPEDEKNVEDAKNHFVSLYQRKNFLEDDNVKRNDLIQNKRAKAQEILNSDSLKEIKDMIKGELSKLDDRLNNAMRESSTEYIKTLKPRELQYAYKNRKLLMPDISDIAQKSVNSVNNINYDELAVRAYETSFETIKQDFISKGYKDEDLKAALRANFPGNKILFFKKADIDTILDSIDDIKQNENVDFSEESNTRSVYAKQMFTNKLTEYIRKAMQSITETPTDDEDIEKVVNRIFDEEYQEWVEACKYNYVEVDDLLKQSLPISKIHSLLVKDSQTKEAKYIFNSYIDTYLNKVAGKNLADDEKEMYMILKKQGKFENKYQELKNEMVTEGFEDYIDYANENSWELNDAANISRYFKENYADEYINYRMGITEEHLDDLIENYIDDVCYVLNNMYSKKTVTEWRRLVLTALAERKISYKDIVNIEDEDVSSLKEKIITE